MNKLTVYFKSIKTGEGDRAKYIYCIMHDAHTDELVLSATMDFAAAKIVKRGWKVVPGYLGAHG